MLLIVPCDGGRGEELAQVWLQVVGEAEACVAKDQGLVALPKRFQSRVRAFEAGVNQ